MKIRYLDGPRLRRGLVAGCDYVQHRRIELNRINVFPVPDGDTGTNLALTASAIADRLRTVESSAVSVVAEEAADAAILGARGNCGMILSHFLLGLSERLSSQVRVNATQFAQAMHGAVDHVYHSLDRPVEGTILTVMRAAAEEAVRVADSIDFTEMLESVLARARQALDRTPDLLPALKSAGVVDAGAKGFVHLLEGVSHYVRGEPITSSNGASAPEDFSGPVAAAIAEYPTDAEMYRYCTEALLRGSNLPDAAIVQDALRPHGDSLIVARGQELLKVHIHTDDPEAVFACLRTFGTLATHKAEDMQAQHAAVERAAAAHGTLARRPLSIVTDSACDLPDEVLRAHGIHMVPMALVYGEKVLRDRVDITADQFFRKLRAGERATTSQPPPKAFMEAYQRAALDGENILAIMVASKLSGTFTSAETAAKRVTDVPIHLFDSRGASLTEGFLALRAAELAEAGMPVEQIVKELERIRQQSGIMFTVDVFDNLLASGRVGRGQVMIAGLLDIKPILGLDTNGQVQSLARVRGSRNVRPRMLELLAERVPAGSTTRFGVIHVDVPEIAMDVAAELRTRFDGSEILVTTATAVLATHLGPGAWGIAWQIES